MTNDELHELKKVTNSFFSTVVLLYCRETYRDELSDEISRIDSELEELNDKLLADTKKIGALILKFFCTKEED